MTSCGYVDTIIGLVLTTARAMELAQKRRRKTPASGTLKKLFCAARLARLSVSAPRALLLKRAAISWTNLAGMSEAAFLASVRSLAQRRAVAKLRAALRRQAGRAASDLTKS